GTNRASSARADVASAAPVPSIAIMLVRTKPRRERRVVMGAGTGAGCRVLWKYTVVHWAGSSFVEGAQSFSRLSLVIPIFGRPFGAEGCVEHTLQHRPRLVATAAGGKHLGQERERDQVARIVGESPSQMLLGFRLTPAKEPRHVEVPLAERRIGRTA